MVEDINIKYRTWFKGLPPKHIKLEVPGWAGEKNYQHGQPWHCKPFRDGSTYGLELIYPFDTECTVTTSGGQLVWSGDFSAERGENGGWERPFSSFAPHHFGFTSSLDLQTEPGYGTMVLPHPRFYTDRTGTVPVAIGGMIESDFWPRVFFVVFKSPAEGQTYVFRKGEGYAQIIVVPKQATYNVSPMTEAEAAARAAMEKDLDDNRRRVATRTWKTAAGEEFDNKYKVLSGVAARHGVAGVADYVEKAKGEGRQARDEQADAARRMFPRRLFGTCKR